MTEYLDKNTLQEIILKDVLEINQLNSYLTSLIETSKKFGLVIGQEEVNDAMDLYIRSFQVCRLISLYNQVFPEEDKMQEYEEIAQNQCDSYRDKLNNIWKNIK